MRKRTGIQLCYPFEERRLTEAKFGWSWPVLVQPKLDGERMRALCSKEFSNPLLLSSTERRIESIPHIKEELRRIKEYIELDGELYEHGESFDSISSKVSRTKNLHEDYSDISYHVFDIVSDDFQIQRSITLLELFNSYDFKYIKRVPGDVCSDMSELMESYKKFLYQGYEGIIIRNLRSPYIRTRSRFVMKFKPKQTDVYEIIEILEGSGEHQNMVGAFVCQGFDDARFKVSAGEFDHSARRQIWKNKSNIIGNYLLISYQNLTENQVPRFGIAKEIIEATVTSTDYEGVL